MSYLARVLFAMSLALNIAIVVSYAHRTHASTAAARTSAAEALSLSREQQAALTDLQDTLRDEVRMLWRDSSATQAAMARTLAEPHPDRDRIRELLDQHGRGRTDLQMVMIESLLAFRSTLDERQQLAFNRQLARPGFLRDLAGFGQTEPKAGARP